jgi:hypothetical protein
VSLSCVLERDDKMTLERRSMHRKAV